MRSGEVKPFFESLQMDLAQADDPQLRSWYETEMSLTPEYQEAIRLQEQVHQFHGLLSLLINKVPIEESQTPHAENKVPNNTETDVKQYENGHSEESKAIKWASDTLDEFLKLPSTRPVKQKKADSRDRNFVRKHLENTRIDDENIGSILRHPDLLAQSLESWAVAAQEKGGRSSRFYEVAVRELGEIAKQQWRDTSKKELAGIMRGWTHAEFAEDAFEHIAKKHFEGPGKLTDQLHAYLDLALAIQYVLDDQPTIDKISDTLYYRTNAIPRGGHIQQAVINSTYRVDDLELCRLGNDIDKISAGVSLIASGDRSAYKHDYYSGVPEGDMTAIILSFAKANDISIIAATRILDDRRQALKAFLEEQEAFDPRKLKEVLTDEFGEEVANWVWQAAYVTSPARAEYVRTFGARAMSNVMREAFKARNEMYRQHPDAYAIKEVLSIPTPNNMMLDILIPEDWEHNPDELATLLQGVSDLVGTEGFDEAEESLKDEESGQAMGYSRLLTKSLYLGEHRVVCAARFSCDLDRLQEHDLNKLMWRNLQSLPVEQFGSNETIGERIRQGQRRFVSKRGFRVTFSSDELTQNGLQSMTIKQDPERPRTLRVVLHYNGQPLCFKLNDRLQIDLEGRRLHSERLQQIIEQRTLAILEDYMTREALESSEGTISGAETGTTTRIAHLAYLPQGYNFSEDAWEHCRREQGIDLRTMSVRRKLVDGEGRNSTYRRATEYDDPNTDPLEIYVNNTSII